MQDEEELNKPFWAFITLIVDNPENYLNNKGKILYKIVLDEGEIKSFTKLAKHLNVYNHTVTRLCRDLTCVGHINVEKHIKNKTIKYSDYALNRGLNIAYEILGKNEY